MNNNSQGTMTDARPTHEQITLRAELLWRAQGSPNGRDEEIWLEAERQLFDEARETFAPPASSAARSTSNSNSSDAPQGAEQMNTKRPATSSARRRSSSGR